MAEQQTRQEIEAELVDRIIASPDLPEATVSADGITKTRGANHRRIHRIIRDSSINKEDDLPGLIQAGQNASVSVNKGGFDVNGNYTPPVITIGIADWQGAWNAATGYSAGDKVTHGNAAYMRITATSESPRAANVTNSAAPGTDATRWQLLFMLGGGGGQPDYLAPVIRDFGMTRLDITDGNEAGDVDITWVVDNPQNLDGNAMTGNQAENGHLGVERSVSADRAAATWTSITSSIPQNILKGGRSARITLPVSNPLIAAGGQVGYRLFGFNNQDPRVKVVSNEIWFTRPQSHEYAYGFTNEPNITWANWDIDSWDQRVSVQNESYHVRMDLEGTVMNNYFVFLFPANREPDRITNSLGQEQRVGTDANDLGTSIELVRVPNALTENSQAFTAYWTRNTNPQNIIFGIYFEFSRS